MYLALGCRLYIWKLNAHDTCIGEKHLKNTGRAGLSYDGSYDNYNLTAGSVTKMKIQIQILKRIRHWTRWKHITFLDYQYTFEVNPIIQLLFNKTSQILLCVVGINYCK